MKKIIFLLFFIFLIANIFSIDYSINKININDISYSKYTELYNDIKILNKNIYVYCLKDYYSEEEKYKNQSQIRGYLKEVLIFSDKFDLVEKRGFTEKKFEYYFDWKYYYIDNNNNIVSYLYKDCDDFYFPTKKIEVYDYKENLLQKIQTPRPIENKHYYIDYGDNVIYYNGYQNVQTLDGSGILDFCIYNYNKNSHKIMKSNKTLIISKIINYDKDLIYMCYNGEDLSIYTKNSFNGLDSPLPVNEISFDEYMYQKYNLIYYHYNNFYGILLKNKIIYQIRFLSSSEELKKNDSSYTDSQSKQTLLVGINSETDKLVKEIKINYGPRWIFNAPNSYDVDDEGNIYILDSKNKNIIKINKDVSKLEIDYSKY